MTRTDVQRLYRVVGGRWWDPFRAQWELVWARNAVRDLDSLLGATSRPRRLRTRLDGVGQRRYGIATNCSDTERRRSARRQ